MLSMFDGLRTRLLPALLTAAGVVLVTAGLLSYADPTAAGVIPEQSEVVETLDPSAEAVVTPSPEPTDSPDPSTDPSTDPSATPIGTAPASLAPEVTPKPGRAVATRVVVPALKIDLPVVKGNTGYPYCNVAMYMPSLSQPLEPGVSFIYAHARTGMFLPLLQQYRANGGRNLIGKQVYVYTSASMRHVYQITSVVVMKSVQSAAGITSERLWLQTSTGPNFTYPKLVIKATRISSAPTTYAASHPAAKIVKCG